MAEIVKLGTARTRQPQSRPFGSDGGDAAHAITAELLRIEATLKALRYRRLVLIRAWHALMDREHPEFRHSERTQRHREKLAQRIAEMESTAATT